MENGVESKEVGDKLIVYDRRPFDSNYTIFRGSRGVHIFLGYFEKTKKVAVKRFQRALLKSACLIRKETNLMLELAGHPNTLQYYCTEMDEDFM